MRKAFKHTGVLLMSFIVGISLIGAAYALWYEDLTLTATVSTGTFDVDWSLEDIDPGTGGVQSAMAVVSLNGEAGPFIPSPAGKGPTCGIVGPDDSGLGVGANDAGDDNLLTLTLSGLYPYAGCAFAIDIHSEGTVPAHVQVVSLTYVCNSGCTEAEELNPPFLAEILPAFTSWAGTCPDLIDCNGTLTAIQACEALVDEDNVGGPVIGGIQLHESNELHCGFGIVLDQVATAEGESWTVQLKLRFKQWNEDNASPAP